MAKKYDGPIDRFTDFTHAGPNGEPASGLAVQNYIKKIDTDKFGVGYTTPGGGDHLFFTDEHDKELYIQDPETYAGLVKDRIPLQAEFTLEVTPISPTYVVTFLGSTGNDIQFTFVTKNRYGQAIADPVSVEYVITKQAVSTTVNEVYQSGTVATFNMDKYLTEGITHVGITVKGQISGISVPFSVEYQVINLSLEDDMDISQVVDGLDSGAAVEIPYTVTGVGEKKVYWYIDGVLVAEDSVADSGITRSKFITVYGLSQGTHSVQFRAGITIDGTEFLTNVHYREFFVSRLEASSTKYFSIATDLPDGEEPIGASGTASIYATQYEPYELHVATWAPDGTDPNTVIVSYGGTQLASLVSYTERENSVMLTFSDTGEHSLVFAIGQQTRTVPIEIAQTSMDIHDISENLVIGFSAQGKSNESSDRATWTDGTHTATLENFDFTETSGWVDGRLLIPSGAHIDFYYAPFGVNPAISGYTFEIEFKTYNVDDDDAVLIDMLNASTGAGIKLTATEISLYSRDWVRAGASLKRRFKTDEDLRISIVVNRASSSAMSCLAEVYFNGILSMVDHFDSNDTFLSLKNLSIGGSDACISVKQIRLYNVALGSASIVNNYILYRDTVDEMLEVYRRNDLYQTGTSIFDIDKIAATLPVMIITGDMSAVENAKTTSATSYVDIDYINLQEPSYSFKWKHVTMKPQGTSSLTYPRKNLRLYTRKSDRTVVYDADGNRVPDRLYSFKSGEPGSIPQRVDCWTLKADFAESSGTHNTGVARIWNEVMKSASTGTNVYPLRTIAQTKALENEYPYDVRTTIDGFPIVVFHRIDTAHNLTFVGKYNFNNDKSTESVFGFKNIPGFDIDPETGEPLPDPLNYGKTTECWEYRVSDVPLVLFKTPTNGRTYAEEFDYYAADYDDRFSGVWECRYQKVDPDNPTFTALRRVAVWLNSTENDLQEWKDNKSDYFDLPKLAAYYVYLMRFGAVDQTVKNAMMTTEDGLHWYFINYDNDTILGVRNDGLLKYDPYIDRQSTDPELSSPGSPYYDYAGHDSVLWNNFEADPECMSLVRTIDNALYGAQLTYANMIDMFNEKQAGKWAEKVYNQDAMYKYIEPYLLKGEPYLSSLQGSRSDHRKWWIASRFSYLDALYVNDAYNNRAITTLIPNAEAGDTFSIVAGKDFYYGQGYDTGPVETGVRLELDESYTFVLQNDFGIGQPLRIYSPTYIKTLDLSPLMTNISTNINLTAAYDESLGTRMKNLILGITDPEDLPDTSLRNNSITELSSISALKALERLNIAGYTALRTLDLSQNENFQTLEAKKSGLTSVTFAPGAPVTTLELPSGMSSLVLRDLPSLELSGLDIDRNVQNKYNITTLHIENCLGLSHSFAFFLDWLDNKAADADECTVYMDNILWEDVSVSDFSKVLDFIEAGGNLTFKGVVRLESIGSQENAERILADFGPNAFNPASSFYVDVDTEVFLSGASTLLEGQDEQYSAIVVGGELGGTFYYQILSGKTEREELNIETGLLTTTEIPSQSGDDTLVIRVAYTVSGHVYMSETKTVVVNKRKYPSSSQVTLTGSNQLVPGIPNTYNIGYTISDITGDMTAVWEFTGDLAGDAHIVEFDNSHCVVAFGDTPSADAEAGVLSMTLYRTVDSSVITSPAKTVTIGYQDDTIAISRAINPWAMDVMVNNNLIHPELGDTNDKMTRNSAMLVTADDLVPSDYSSSIFNTNAFRSNCTNFDEFQYFTGVFVAKSGLFRNCSALQSVKIPDSVVTIQGISGSQSFSGPFASCQNLRTITIPRSVTTIGAGAFRGSQNIKHITFEGDVPAYVLAANSSSSGFPQNTVDTVTIMEGCTSIGTSAFQDNIRITSIILPSTLRTIGDYAFDSTALTSIVIPPGVTSMGNNCFRHSSLQSVTLSPACAAIPSAAFMYCPITNVIIPEGVTQINSQAFQNCTYLSQVSLPDSLERILGGAFGNTALQSVEFGSGLVEVAGAAFAIPTLQSVSFNAGLTTIGNGAFSGTALTDITLPSSVTSIAATAFYTTNPLLSITFGCLVPSNAFGNPNGNPVFNADENTQITLLNTCPSIGQSAFQGVDWLSALTIPESVTSIGDRAFYNCTSITSLRIPSSVTTVGQNVIYGCSSLERLDYAAQVAGSGAFLNECPALTTLRLESTAVQGIRTTYILNSPLLEFISVESGNPTWSDGNGSNCLIATSSNKVVLYLGGKSTTIPDNVQVINDCAFYKRSNMGNLVLPSSLESIYNNAFFGCSTLTTTIPDTVSRIDMQAFANCESLDTSIPVLLSSLGNLAFSNTGLTSVTIPTRLPSLPSENPFAYCKNLTTLTVADGSTNFSSEGNCILNAGKTQLYVGCKNSIIPSTVTFIRDYAFEGITGIVNLALPEGVVSIGNSVFNRCLDLRTVSFPASFQTLTASSFTNCAIDSISVASGNTLWNDGNGQNCLIKTADNKLWMGCSNSVIPSTVTAIGPYAFNGRSGLTSITIPSSVITIDLDAFNGCSGLTSITIPSSVTTLNYRAFGNCSSLVTVNINCNIPQYAFVLTNTQAVFYKSENIESLSVGDGCTSVGGNAFNGQSWITTIDLPSTVTSIGSSAFYNTNLTSATIRATTPPTIQSNTWYDVDAFYVPSGSLTAYKSASNWYNYRNKIYAIE